MADQAGGATPVDTSGGGSGSSAMDSMGSLGPGLGMISGAVQMFQAQGLKNKADAAFPSLYDPMQMGFLSELNQKRKSLDVGSGYAAGMNAIGASTAGTNASIIQNGGGNFAGTMDALLKSQRVGQDQQNQVLANGENQQLHYNSMYGELLNTISARAMQLRLAQSEQARAEWAQKQKEGSANFNAGASSLMSNLTPDSPNASSGSGGGGSSMPMSGGSATSGSGAGAAGGSAVSGSGAGAAGGAAGSAGGAGAAGGAAGTVAEAAPLLALA